MSPLPRSFLLASVVGISVCLGQLSASGLAEEPKWIWNDAAAVTKAGQDPLLFRRQIELPNGARRAELTVTCDNRYEVVINGILVGQGEDWQKPNRYSLVGLFRKGSNQVTIRAKNDDDGPAGLCLSLEITGDDSSQMIYSDAAWSVQPDRSKNDVWWGALGDKGWSPAIELGVWDECQPWAGRVAWDDPSDIQVKRSIRPKQEQFEFLDGDRVTWIGGTWVERQQAFNYFETLVTSAYPDRKITFRNLGWSGDDVFGTARAVFGTQEDGFQRLRDDLLRTSPNVIFVNYGGNESFAGTAGLDQFRQGWERLTRLLASTGATVVVISPHYLENLGPPLPNPTPKNQNIDLYCETLKSWSGEQGFHFIDRREFFPKRDDFVPTVVDQLTDNGIHYSDYGYWRSAPRLAAALQVPLPDWTVELGVNEKAGNVDGGRIVNVRVREGVELEIRDDQHPYASAPETSPRGGDMVGLMSKFKIGGLPEGTYGLNIDGQPSVMATHDQWSEGILIDRGKYIGRLAELRAAIAKKNELYFHRYRPQNETYLFLFRKHEQGNNAVEVPQFEPLVAEQEALIDELKQPKKSVYQLIRIRKPDQQTDDK